MLFRPKSHLFIQFVMPWSFFNKCLGGFGGQSAPLDPIRWRWNPALGLFHASVSQDCRAPDTGKGLPFLRLFVDPLIQYEPIGLLDERLSHVSVKLPAGFSAPAPPFITMPNGWLTWLPQLLPLGLAAAVEFGFLGACSVAVLSHWCLLHSRYLMSSLKRIASHELGEEGEDSCLFPEPKRRRSFLNAVREVMKMQSMQCLFLELEPFLRRVVREEVQKGLSRYVYSASRPLFNQIQAPMVARWRLSFKSKLPDTLFTGSRIESEDNAPVKIAIEDSNTGMILATGPLSSVRIEIVVLDGDFCAEEQEYWTEREFTDCVVREREGKRPLLTGDLVIPLREGVSTFGAVTFTDNSSWIRSRKFRLGARILPSNCIEERIQEAISGAFFVKDHRGELYKKHHPPALHDDVWRLEKIGKDGAFHKRLSENGIRTVQDFLKSLVVDQDWLRSILGNGMSNKIWEATVEHAWECLLDHKLYSYYIGENQVMLVFNCIFQAVGAKFDGDDYQPISNLTPPQMALVNGLKQYAYRNRNEIIEIDLPVGVLSRRLAVADSSVAGSSSQDLHGLTFSDTLRDEQATPVRLDHPFDHPLQAEVSEDPAVQVQLLSSFSRSSLERRDLWCRSDDYSMELSTSGRGATSGETFLGYGPEAGMAGCFPHALAWDLGNRTFQLSDNEVRHDYPSPAPGFGVHIPRSKWVKLMAALKCGMFIRRRVAAKRRARLFGYQPLPGFPRNFQL